MMKIEKINKNRVIRLSKQTEYLVWQGCGGPLEDWYNGITKMFIDNEIADKDYKMQEMYVFDNNGTTCILTPLENLSISKLAFYRMSWRNTFGTMWLSDFIDNGYLN